MILENFQMGVDEAINGKIALDMFKEGYERKCNCVDRAYKLIIMDLQMPVMGGIEASREIIKLVKKTLSKKSSNLRPS
jgi:CheY-like chemotaxis protein